MSWKTFQNFEEAHEATGIFCIERWTVTSYSATEKLFKVQPGESLTSQQKPVEYQASITSEGSENPLQKFNPGCDL